MKCMNAGGAIRPIDSGKLAKRCGIVIIIVIRPTVAAGVEIGNGEKALQAVRIRTWISLTGRLKLWLAMIGVAGKVARAIISLP